MPAIALRTFFSTLERIELHTSIRQSKCLRVSLIGKHVDDRCAVLSHEGIGYFPQDSRCASRVRSLGNGCFNTSLSRQSKFSSSISHNSVAVFIFFELAVDIGTLGSIRPRLKVDAAHWSSNLHDLSRELTFLIFVMVLFQLDSLQWCV